MKENYKEFIRNSKLLWKTEQQFKSERHNVSTEEINKIALCSNYDKGMQSLDSIEIYIYICMDLVSEKEVIKCNNITKRRKNDYLWWCCKWKHKRKIGHKFLIICTEY